MSIQLNGWDLDAMTQAVEAVKQQPDAGKLIWRSRVNWDGGFGLDVRTLEIQQLDTVMPRRFTMRGDHPPALLGDNTGPTAIETLLGALGACMSGTFAAQATARGVKVDALEVDVQATIDLNGFFGLSSVNPGLTDVKLAFRVEADVAPDILEEILDATKARSPVRDSLTRPVDVSASFAD